MANKKIHGKIVKNTFIDDSDIKYIVEYEQGYSFDGIELYPCYSLKEAKQMLEMATKN